MSRLIRSFIIISLALLTVLPYLFWILSQVGLTLNWLNALFIIVATSVIARALGLYKVRSQYLNNKLNSSIVSSMNVSLKTLIYRFSFLIILVVLIVMVYYGYSSDTKIIEDIPIELEE